MKTIIYCLLGLLISLNSRAATETGPPLRIAVEFMDHAAAAQVARSQQWFQEAGLLVTSFDSYITGMALAAALARGEVDAAYLCLVPAINTRINAGIDIRIVCGTHLYGYALVVNPEKVKVPHDLLDEEIEVGCVRPGGAVDVLMNRWAEINKLDRSLLEQKARRMSPPRLVLALVSGQLDAIFVPEHYASLAESAGYTILSQAQDCWPGMTGSVLVVTSRLLEERPEEVKKLVLVTKRATEWIRENPRLAAETVAAWLSDNSEKTSSPGAPGTNVPALPLITPQVIFNSMNRLVYATDLDLLSIRDTMAFMKELGYISDILPLEEIVETRFLP